METDLARVLDAATARALPALETEHLDGWQLRASGSLSGRASSVLPAADGGRLPLAARLDAVERFYADRGLPAKFLLSPASVPRDLDAALDRRGYTVLGPVLVQTASLPAAADAALPSRPDARWLTTWSAATGRGEAELSVAERILRRVRLPQAFVLVELDGRPATVGRGVLDGEWLGVFQMATVPSLRRRGGAHSALAQLAAWGQANGGARAYLQVHSRNVQAQRVYADAGFVTAYAYWYRVSP